MRKQKEGWDRESREQVQKVFQHEEAVSQAFQISNFYTNQRLNIAELKHRLEEFKKHQKQPHPLQQPQQMLKTSQKIFKTPQPQNEPQYIQQYSQKYGGTFAAQLPSQKQKVTLPNPHKHRLSHYQDNTRNQERSIRKTISPDYQYIARERVEQIKQTNYRIVKQTKRYEGKPRTSNGNHPHLTLRPPQPSRHSQQTRGQSRVQHNRAQNLNTSKCSNSSQKRSNASQNWGLEGIIAVNSRSELIELQKQINTLWEHYQLLTKILVGLRQGTRNQKNAIVKYVQDVCTNRFEFIRDLLIVVTKQGAQKNVSIFTKRLRRSVVLSRLLQNLAVVYVGLGISMQRQPQAYLVNFVGYCCSNITFLIRMSLLMHTIGNGLKVSAPVGHIIEVIKEFEEGSYKATITKLSDVVLRMEQNNDIIWIVQGKLCNSMDKQFQKIISIFLKNVDLDSKPLFQYSHYIYQFLAFNLASKNISGQFNFIEMAPSPYFDTLPKPKTLVIEPWQVLIACKGTSIYIRSYAETFLKEVGKYWNIVYWTDLMPQIADGLLQNLPPGKVLYRYHCRYENDRYLKLLWRLGADNDNTIIIDRDEANFRYDKDMGIALPWKGQKKDNKLLELLGLLHNKLLIQDKATLRPLFPVVKQNFQMKKQQRRSIRSSEHRDEIESMLPRAVTKNKKANRAYNYQQ